MVFIIFALLGIVREVVCLIERQYNKKVMVTTIVTDACSAVVAAIWLMNNNILNKNFVDEICNLLDDSNLTSAIFGGFNYFFFGCIMLALTMNTIVTIFKTIKNRK